VAVANLGNLLRGERNLALGVEEQHEVVSGAVTLGERKQIRHASSLDV
jgi:hypothetical protein